MPRLVELLKQPQYAPYLGGAQVVSVWAGTSGSSTTSRVEDIRRFEAEFLDNVAREHAGHHDLIRETAELSDDTVGELETAVDEFKRYVHDQRGRPARQGRAGGGA